MAPNDLFELNVSAASPCILAPPQCSLGATYMVWIKQIDNNAGHILSTSDMSPPKEGIKFDIKGDGLFRVKIFKEGSSSNRFEATVPGLNSYINTWVHITTVWYIDRRIVVYFNAKEQVVSQSSFYTDATFAEAAPMRMIVGRKHVTDPTPDVTKNMLLDELKFYDRPLNQIELPVLLTPSY